MGPRNGPRCSPPNRSAEAPPLWRPGGPGGTGGGPGEGRRLRTRELPRRRFVTGLDQDKDGVLTQAEFTDGFRKWFVEWDTKQGRPHSGRTAGRA